LAHRVEGAEIVEEALRFGIAPPNWGPFGAPGDAADLAVVAEKAGWDGYFTWDALIVKESPPPTYDPWVILSSVAMATERIRIGTCVAVLPRYKPHLLAMTLASLDVLSGGRLTLGVGIGDWSALRNFDAFGEAGDLRIRAEKLDEGLEVISGLWSGEKVNHRGKHYIVEDFALTAVPVQQPRIPIWVGGDSPPALRRAARWDGWIGPDDNPLETTPDDVTAVRRRLDEAGGSPRSVDIAWAGKTGPGDGEQVEEYHRAGATWWIEILLGARTEVLTRVADGPPR
jgi:probable F420-dependent oxidoreductase